MFAVEQCSIPGLRLLRPRIAGDSRGKFVKIMHAEFFAAHGLRWDFREQYYSVSRDRVLRGFHFQTPPMEHAKLVTCLSGRVMDVVVDLRRGSPRFGEHEIVELSEDNAAILYIPVGCGHGFLAQSPTAMLLYDVSSVYAPQHDTGVRWDSLGVAWPVADPIISARDSQLVPFADFDSPFEFNGDRSPTF
jgi:dTDP-4-dehydrorhamnose 3,5-epimerase